MKEIFLVHDRHESSWVRQHYLEGAGFRVTAFPSGDQCLHALFECLPDLVLLDVLIEGRNGFDVCAAIRADFPAERLPIVLGSEIYRDEPFQEEARRVGAQRYLLKPCDPEQLVAAISELVGTRGDEAAA